MRNPLVPLALLAIVAGLTLGLALWTPFAPSMPNAPTAAGNAVQGEGVFSTACAGCHGTDGSGGVGPTLTGSGLSAEQVAGIVAAGRGAMPGALVEGRDLADVAAYVALLSQ